MLPSFSRGPDRGVDERGDEVLLKFSDVGLKMSGYVAFPGGDEGMGEIGTCVDRLFVLAIAALSTCVSEGLIPHARQGGNGVWAFANAGSKFDGTGLEKLQMVHTQVAEVMFEGAGAGREEASALVDDSPLRWGLSALEVPRVRTDGRLGGFGTSVTLGDDFKKPA